MWLLLQETYDAMHAPEARIPAGYQAAAGDILSRSGSDAIINIQGVLTPRPDLLAEVFGGGNTTYASIQNAILAAEADPTVERLVFSVDSPGGAVSGLFEAMDTIKNTKKPTVSRVSGTAASAAYGLVAMTDRIEATNRGAVTGSVGVVLQGKTDPQTYAFTSSGAKNKRPDINTEEGRAEVQRKLDEAEALFVEYIADARGIPRAELMDRFGNGSTFLTDAAISRGMVDGYYQQTNAKEEGKPMDVKTLQAEHPALFAEVKSLGASEALDTVKAHLIRGKECNALDVAAEAIEQGAGMTETYRAKYDNAALAARIAGEHASAEQELNAQTQGVQQDTQATQQEKDDAFAEALVANLMNEGVL